MASQSRKSRSFLQARMGFSLHVEASEQAGRQAGNGLWLQGKADVGSVVALYPGLVYTSENYRQVPQSRFGARDSNNACLLWGCWNCAGGPVWLTLSADSADAYSRSSRRFL